MQKTLENLTKAFIGESQARNRYTYYAKVAQKEGYEQIGSIFLETADQEKTHAKRLFEHIQELKKGQGEIKVEASAPIVYGDTKENLKAAIAGEAYEYTKMYPEFSQTAIEEGLTTIASRLEAIAKAEEHHKNRYEKLLKVIEANQVHIKETETVWICRECGYLHTGLEAPKECPACDHSQGFYQVQCEKY
ncbi:MAG: rubrerythrin [Patescibacteria group bacterium]